MRAVLAAPWVARAGVAELGATAALSSEIATRVAEGVSGGQGVTQGLWVFPGERSSIFFVDSSMPEISLLSMVAPSPDWFVGVSGLSLRDELGWIPERSVDLEAPSKTALEQR